MVGIFDTGIFDTGIFDHDTSSSGNTTITFSTSGVVFGPSYINGISNLTFDNTAAAISSGEMIANASLNFFNSVTISAIGIFSGFSDLVFNNLAKLEDVKDMEANSLIKFSYIPAEITTVPNLDFRIYGLSSKNKSRIYGVS